MRRARERGGALIDTIVALGLLAVVAGMAMAVLGSTSRLATTGRGETDRLWSRAKADRELSAAEYAAADLAYFDLEATVSQLRRASAPDARDAALPVPPAGHCGPIDPLDSATWPVGFDPSVRSTWTVVTWWAGMVRSDPSTWYYDCSEPPGPPRIVPVYSYGDGLVFSGSVTIAGPAAVTAEARPLFADQVGNSLTLVRTAAGAGPFQLGGSFDTSAAVLRLVARDVESVTEVEGLLAGDVLVVTGRETSGAVTTAVAELQEAPRQVAVPSPTDDRGEVILRYYEARVSPSNAAVRWGLQNGLRAASGATISEDASVALLDRDAGVTTFYTAREGDGTMTLYKVIGSPATPEHREALVKHAARALTAVVETRTVADATGTRELATAIDATMVVAAEPQMPAEPLHTRVEFAGAAHQPRRIGLRYGEFETSTPLPPPTMPQLEVRPGDEP